MQPSAGNQHTEARLTGPRYRITYATLYVVLLVVGLVCFTDSEDWISRVANICVATAGIAFAIAEVIEVATVIGQAIREIRKARREKRDQALIEQGRQQGRQEERERQKERLRDDDSPSKGGATQKPRE